MFHRGESSDQAELVQRLAGGAAQVDIETESGGKTVGFVYLGCECQATTHVLVIGLETFFEVGGLSVHLQIEDGGFIAPDAAQTPAGGDHFRYEVDLDLVRRLEIIEISVHDFQKMSLTFIAEDEGFGGEAVAGGIERRRGAAFG